MAGKGLTIPLSLDPREWLRGIKVVERSLEGMEDDLDEVERAGDKLERALEDNFKDAARAAERAGRDMNDGLEKGLGADSGNLKTAAGSLAGEVVDEFVENWGEAVRSGDYASAFRETLSQLGQIGGAIGGPTGAIIGGAVALGLTTAFDAVMNTEGKDRMNAIAASALSGFADVAAEQGGKSWEAYRDGFISSQSVDEALTEALGAGSLFEALEQVKQLGADAGTSIEADLVTALTDSGPAGENAASRIREAFNAANTAVQQEQEKINLLRAEGTEGAALTADTIANTVMPELRKERDAVAEALGYIDDQDQALQEAGTAASILAQSQQDVQSETYGATEEQRQLNRALIEGGGLSAAIAGNMAAGARSASDLKYWLDQASRVDVRVAGVTGVGGVPV